MSAGRKQARRRWERRARERKERAWLKAYEAQLIESAARRRERAKLRWEVSLTLRDMLNHLWRLIRGHRVTRRERLTGEWQDGFGE